MKLYVRQCRPVIVKFATQGFPEQREPLEDWQPEENEEELKVKYNKEEIERRVFFAELDIEYRYVEYSTTQERRGVEALDAFSNMIAPGGQIHETTFASLGCTEIDALQQDVRYKDKVNFEWLKPVLVDEPFICSKNIVSCVDALLSTMLKLTVGELLDYKSLIKATRKQYRK